MAWTFPLSLAQFYDRLKIAPGPNWQLARYDQTSVTGNSAPLAAELASPLWTLPVTLAPMPNAEADQILSIIEMLCHPGRAFYFSNPKRETPQSDPTGSILGGIAPTIQTLATNNHQLRLTGLPNGYRLTQGDMLAFDYGPAGQKRRALHRFTETMAATSAGLTPLIEVFPHIRAGALVGDSVTLIKPALLATIVAGSLDPGTADPVNTTGIKFTIHQRLI